MLTSISGLVVEYIVAIDVTRARFPADAHVGIVSGVFAACCAMSACRDLDPCILFGNPFHHSRGLRARVCCTIPPSWLMARSPLLPRAVLATGFKAASKSSSVVGSSSRASDVAYEWIARTTKLCKYCVRREL